MNNKVTFQELVDAIAEQSGKSKQFTHDYIKDLVSLIRESLEKDGNINIAGLGKFELKKMDEREGYNPQTDEKITIPAHNKIDFTPYKDLRELVNAPYSHMEPEIIEDEGVDEEEAVSDEGEKQTDESAESIPPDSPTESSEEPEKKKAPWEEDMESEIEVDEDDPFGLNAQRTTGPSLSFEDEEEQDEGEDNDDIVEFTPGLEPDTEEPEEKEPESEEPIEPEQPVRPQKDVGTEKEETESEVEDEAEKEIEKEDVDTAPPVRDTEDETQASKEESEPEEPVHEKDEVEKEETEPKPKSGITFRDRRHRKRDSGGGSTFWIIAAAFIILLIAIGAWYFMGSQQGMPPDSMDSQMVQNETAAEEQKEQESAQATESQQDQQTAADQPSDPGQAQDTGADAQQTTDTRQQAASDPQTDRTAQPDEPPVETITVVSGQTLWGIADSEYDNPYLWPWIYDTNKPEIENPNIIYVGQALDIPQRRGADNGLSTSDSLQVALGYVETYLWYKENELENARFYLYAAKKYHSRVFEHTDAEIDEADLAFANRAQ